MALLRRIGRSLGDFRMFLLLATVFGCYITAFGGYVTASLQELGYNASGWLLVYCFLSHLESE